MRWFAIDSVVERIRVNSLPALRWEWCYRDGLALDCRGSGRGGRGACALSTRVTMRSDAVLSCALKRGARQAGVDKPIGAHTLRHSFATHFFEGGYDNRTIQELLGHKDVATTQIFTHVLNRGGHAVLSPLDR